MIASVPTLRITSKACNPAAAASLLRATSFTITPLGTPRYSAICEVSGSTSAPTFSVPPKNGMWNPGSAASPPLPRIPNPGGDCVNPSPLLPILFQTSRSITRRSASSTASVWIFPSRLISRLTLCPAGISRNIRLNCSAPSTGCPFSLSTTSLTRSPIRPAGASWSISVITAPRISLSFSDCAFSWSTSVRSTPR